jgi:multiple sugar transport system permease protein
MTSHNGFIQTSGTANQAKKAARSQLGRSLGTVSYNLLAWFLLVLYLLPVVFMVDTALKSTEQLMDSQAPWYPARLKTYLYQGQADELLQVQVAGRMETLALVQPGTMTSQFIDPQDPAAGLIEWQGNYHKLQPVYEPYFVWSNFAILFKNLPFPKMVGNTLLVVLIGEIGVLLSSILIAYGFSRFPLPGGDLLFYVVIATILIPEKITFIPTFFFYVRVVHWQGTIYPLIVYLFFGSPVFIFLLRQNFRTIPIDLEESAMLDGAGPLRRLTSIVLPQTWPAVVTVGLLQFFATWNETRLASLYLGANSHFMPVSFAVQLYQSLVPIQNVIESASLVVMVVPVVVLILSQRLFMRSLTITGLEKL